MRSIDAKLAEHVLKLDVILQRLFASGFSLFAVRMLVKPYHFGLNLPTTLAKTKMGYISLPSVLNSIISNNKLLLCNSQNGDIA